MIQRIFTLICFIIQDLCNRPLCPHIRMNILWPPSRKTRLYTGKTEQRGCGKEIGDYQHPAIIYKYDITHSETRRDKTAITLIRIGQQRKSSICIYREKTEERFEGRNTSYGKNAMCQSQWTMLFYSDV